MYRLQSAYARQRGVPPDVLRFLSSGLNVNDHDTPASLGLEDNDQIDVMLEQLGD